MINRLLKKFHNTYQKLERENNHLHKVIDKFYFAIDKFIEWICQKFSLGDTKELVNNFEKDTDISLVPELQVKIEKEWDLEL